MNAELELLLRLHDGDDRCGCLRQALIEAVDNGQDEAIRIVRDCLEQHPSGSTYYRRC